MSVMSMTLPDSSVSADAPSRKFGWDVFVSCENIHKSTAATVTQGRRTRPPGALRSCRADRVGVVHSMALPSMKLRAVCPTEGSSRKLKLNDAVHAAAG